MRVFFFFFLTICYLFRIYRNSWMDLLDHRPSLIQNLSHLLNEFVRPYDFQIASYVISVEFQANTLRRIRLPSNPVPWAKTGSYIYVTVLFILISRANTVLVHRRHSLLIQIVEWLLDPSWIKLHSKSTQDNLKTTTCLMCLWFALFQSTARVGNRAIPRLRIVTVRSDYDLDRDWRADDTSRKAVAAV